MEPPSRPRGGGCLSRHLQEAAGCSPALGSHSPGRNDLTGPCLYHLDLDLLVVIILSVAFLVVPFWSVAVLTGSRNDRYRASICYQATSWLRNTALNRCFLSLEQHEALQKLDMLCKTMGFRIAFILVGGWKRVKMACLRSEGLCKCPSRLTIWHAWTSFPTISVGWQRCKWSEQIPLHILIVSIGNLVIYLTLKMKKIKQFSYKPQGTQRHLSGYDLDLFARSVPLKNNKVTSKLKSRGYICWAKIVFLMFITKRKYQMLPGL